jgi:hypothetical protein
MSPGNSVPRPLLSHEVSGFSRTLLPQAFVKEEETSWVSVVPVCNPSYLGGCDGDDQGSRVAQANSLRDPISKITRAKWTGSVEQTVERLLCQSKALSSNSNPKKKLKKKKKRMSKEETGGLGFETRLVLRGRGS